MIQESEFRIGLQRLTHSQEVAVARLEILTGKIAKLPTSDGGGDKKLTADEWLAEELKKGK